ncbi:MAG: hypothetical protein DRJ29_14610 [Bacteroidetes bacterium]|nr:MAG: hypothetical protein DRI98_10965 [Bacteroidota bacterium]RLD91052.1 MAG: hypothetical protein DRJ29_14610 [Bacteroidota bacterium]
MTINNLVVFIYESGICLAIMFTMYWLFLRRETYFRFNRFYLLSTIIIAFTLPLGNLSLFENGNGVSALGGISSVAETIRIPAVTIAAGSDSGLKQSFNWQDLAVVIYLIGAALLFARTILGIVRVTILKKKGEVVYKDGYSIVYMKQKLAPFSFLKTIFINDALPDGPDKSSIIIHERIHIRQKHTYDNLFVEFFLAIFWFNPFMWFLKRALRNTHEYLADNGVLVGSTSRTSYHSLLLKQIIGLSPLVVTSSFNSTIKKRIKMMCRNKSSVLAKFKPLFLVPMIILLTLVFACSEIPEDPAIDNMQEIVADEMVLATEQPDETIDSPTNTAPVDEEIFFIVEEMPTFNGGEPATEFRKYISQNLQFPETAAENGTEGRVIVQFAVDKNGKVVDANVVRSVNPALDKEAVRVVMSSPDWEPGKQRGKAVKILFTFPINFIVSK